MPTVRQQIVETPARTFGFGSSDSIASRALFRNSFIFNTTDNQVRDGFQFPAELVNGIMSDGGYAFNTVNRFYGEAPNLAETVVGGGGLPGSPYGPNIASSDPSMNPASIPAEGVEATERVRGHGNTYGTGDNFASPHAARERLVSARRTIADSLPLGRSSTTVA